MKPLPLLYAVLFAVAHTQSPLYYSNQNQYFLKGVAAGSDSQLSHDWLVGTADPVPVFSAFVAGCVRTVGEWPFQVVFFLALVGYFLAMWRLVEKLPFAPRSPGGWTAFAFAFTAVHAGLLRWVSTKLLGEDYLWFFQSGLANQYLLGPGLQPSVVGVLLLWAVAEYANEKPIRAAALAAGATLVHSTYLLPAAMLSVGFAVHLLVLKQWKTALFTSITAAVFALPAVTHILVVFAPTDAATFAESQRILAEVRIPHHCRPARWFDWAGGVQVVWMLLGLVLLRKTRLFVPLAVVSGLVVIGTVAVIVTNNPTLSLLFPWRVTAVLVPVSTAVVFGAMTSRLGKPSPPPLPDGLLRPCLTPPIVLVTLLLLELGFALCFVGSAVVVYALQLGYRDPESETELLTHVAATRCDADVYLIPAKFPGPPKSPGVYSKTFTPPDPAFSDLARFRLATRARLFVDFKAIPYKDTDVIEWHRRVSSVARWYATADWDASGVIDEVVAEGISHVIVPTDKTVTSTRLELELETPKHRLYRVRPYLIP
jgi:hypothetical protein